MNNSNNEPIVIWASGVHIDAVNAAIETYQREGVGSATFQVNLVEPHEYEYLINGGIVPNILIIDDLNLQALLEEFPSLFVSINDLDESLYVPFAASNVTKNNKIYGVPYYSGAVALYYRKDIMDELGVDMHDNLTWEELCEIGQQLRSYNNMYLFPPLKNYEAQILMQSAGKCFYDEGNNISDSGVSEVLQLISQFSENDLIYPEYDLDQGVVNNILVLDDQIAATFGDSRFLSRILLDSNKEWGVIKLPKSGIFTNEVSYKGYSCMVLNDPEKVADCVEFLACTFGSNQDLAKELAQNFSIVPVLNSAISDMDNLNPIPYLGGRNVIKFLAELGEEIPLLTYGKYSNNLSNLLNDIAIEVQKGEVDYMVGTEEFLSRWQIIKDLVRLEITKAPDKMSYIEGDKFNKSGLELSAVYSDGTIKRITDFTCSPEILTLENNRIAVKCLAGTCYINVNVVPALDYLRRNKTSTEYGNNPKVNLATGRLQYVMPDLSIGANSYKIDIAHIYMGASISKGMGTGWKLNAHQYLSTNSNGKISYVDANGYVTDFVLFDEENQRYNDESGKGLILCKETNGYTIKDDYGNLLKFNSVGNICETVSAINSSIKKVFEYDSANRLIKVYDNRKPNTYVSFVYEDELLSKIKAVDNNTVAKTIEYVYEQDALVGVSVKVGTESKKIAKFIYDNYRKLQYIIDCESKQAVKIIYDIHLRAERLSSGIVGEQLTFESFTEKDFVSFTYQDDTSCHINSCETVVTNKKGISQVAFVNTQGELVSTFEKVSDGLKTLTKEAGHYIQTTGFGTSFNSGKIVSGTSSVNITSSATINGEDTYKNYAFTCWLNHSANCSAASAFLTFTCDGTTHTYSAPIDPYAKGCWQLVSIPITLGENKTLTNVSLKVFCAGGATSIGTIKVAEARVMPQEKITNIFYDVDVALDKQINLILETETEELDIQLGILSNNSCIYNANSFITFNDIYRNLFRKEKSSNGYYDFVYCNGVKTIKGVKSAMIYDVDCGYDIDIVSDLSTFGIRKESIDGLTVTSQTVKFGADRISTLTNAVRYAEADDTEALVSSDAQTDINYYGQKLSAKDAYGVTTKYTYDNFGNVTSVDLIGSDGGTLNVQSNSYDENSQYLSSQLSGANTCNFTYKKPFDLVESQSVVNDTLTNFYGAFFDSINKVTRVKSEESYGEKLFTYENGLVRTISDGNCKLGAQYNPINDNISFSVFNSCEDNATGNIIQKNSMYKSGEEYVLEKNYYNTATVDVITRNSDKYGKVQSISYGNIVVDFDYKDVGSSQASWPVSKITDDLAGVTTTYKFDDRNNVCGWETSEGMTVEQMSSIKTKYSLNNSDSYIAALIYDNTKTIAPRLSKTNIYRNSIDNEVPYVSKSYNYDEFGRLSSSGYYKSNFYSDTDMNVETITTSTTVYSSSSIPSYDDKRRVKTLNNRYHYSNTQTGITQYSSSKNTNIDYEFDYNEVEGKLTITETGAATESNSSILTTNVTLMQEYEFTHTYQFDKFNRIDTETNPILGTRSYTYEGNVLRTVTDNGTKKNYYYNDKGQLALVQEEGVSLGESYEYDNYGNRISYSKGIYQTKSYSWTRGNLLSAIGSYKYTYDYNRMRKQKEIGVKTIKYHVDGAKLLGETISDSSTNTTENIYYFYDALGICGLEHKGIVYSFIKDAFGNIAVIMNGTAPVARYYYDAFGNCKVLNPNGTENTDANFIGNINPIRWKSYYYDVESGYYYANCRYYDPAVGKYLDADSAENILRNINAILPLDRNGILCDNILNFPENQYNIQLQTYLYADPEVYEPTWIDNVVGWWNDLDWGWKVGGTIVFVAALAVASYYTGGIASTILAEAAKTAAISAVIGFGAGGITYSDGQAVWDINSAANGAVNGAITGAIAGGLGGAVSNVGKGFTQTGKMLVQGGLNAAIAGGVTAVNGLITGDFSWTSVGVASVFGFWGGWFGTYLKGVRSIVSSAGLGIAEASIGELIELIESKYNFNFLFVMPYNYV